MRNYQYREDIATADAAFDAFGSTPEELFMAAADATLNVMVENIEDIRPARFMNFRCAADSMDMLIFMILGEILFYKDAERLLYRVNSLRLKCGKGSCSIDALFAGESIDPDRHRMLVDVKAVTLHRFRVERIVDGWEATVVLDI
ncbi:MAG: archease [Candidatus Latescibacteria bacterium]|nr:archease [Candidatus Latescibacterota bacterium]